LRSVFGKNIWLCNAAVDFRGRLRFPRAAHVCKYTL
jgi:hypothetical protein